MYICICICIARRHGHVFRMALHNEGDWRMETWQRARRASCHVSIRQSPSCVMPFWTHAKCLLAFISYLPMWIKAKYTFIKTVYSPRFYGGPYMQAKHADVCSGVLFWTACTRRPHVLSLPSRCENPIHDGKQGQLKVRKSHERYHNVVTWHWIVYKWRRSKQRLSFHRIFFNLLVFTVSLSCRDWHSETPWSHSSNRRYVLSGTGVLLRTNYWKCDARMQDWQIKSPPAMWKHLSFECLGVIVVALNGKSASMLLESTKNKLKQWLVIEKSVNKCNFSPDILKLEQYE